MYFPFIILYFLFFTRSKRSQNSYLHFLLYYYMNLIKYGKYRNYGETYRLKRVSSIEHYYLEAATGGVHKNFVIFTGKYLCYSFFLIRFIEKRLQHWCFPLHVRKCLRTPILKNISYRLLLIILLVQQFFFVFGCLL